MAMEFLTPNELSCILKLHPFTITRLAREGKIPGLKVSGVWRFRKDEFERWVVQQGPKKRNQRRRESMVLAGRFQVPSATGTL